MKKCRPALFTHVANFPGSCLLFPFCNERILLFLSVHHRLRMKRGLRQQTVRRRNPQHATECSSCTKKSYVPCKASRFAGPISVDCADDRGDFMIEEVQHRDYKTGNYGGKYPGNWKFPEFDKEPFAIRR